jgi:tyrosyl-tRNA synthetase
MQAADVFFLKADICQLGMDQRKVNMLAREYCDLTNIKVKPVILSHHMLSGLKEGQEKMSKSDPDSAIFMEDSEADVKRKIKSAFCPPGVENGNPCLDWTEYILFGKYPEILISRKPENGGDSLYRNYEDLRDDYVSGKIHPGDLKAALVKYINEYVFFFLDQLYVLQTARASAQAFQSGRASKIARTCKKISSNQVNRESLSSASGSLFTRWKIFFFMMAIASIMKCQNDLIAEK